VQNEKILAKLNGKVKNIEGSNNVTGEVNSVLVALKYLTKKKLIDIVIYYDYQGIAS
jgi:hypothetical protein